MFRPEDSLHSVSIYLSNYMMSTGPGKGEDLVKEHALNQTADDGAQWMSAASFSTASARTAGSKDPSKEGGPLVNTFAASEKVTGEAVARKGFRDSICGLKRSEG